MNDNGKRSLRERRAPKAFDQEVQDTDPYGYGRPPFAKDAKTPSQQMNLDAKLLAKFVNKVNKTLRQHEADHRRREIENIKEPVAVRERKTRLTDPIPDPQQRTNDALTPTRQDYGKKSKELYNFKPNSGQSAHLPQKNEAFLNKIKNITMQSASNMRLLEMGLPKTKPELNRSSTDRVQLGSKATQSQVQQIPGFHSQNGKNSQLSPSPGSFFFKDKDKAQKAHQLQDRLGLQRSNFSSSNKVFKRSSYHVAISYYIYIKKLREKGPIGSEIDPTSHARRLKSELSK